MTIGITGPEQKAPGRRNVLAGLIVVGIASAIGLILLGQLGDFLVDTMWFSAIGYSQVFWTTVAAKVGVFLAVFAATFLITWASAGLALHRRRRDVRPPTAFDWKLAAPATSSDLLDLILSRLPFSVVIAAGAGFVALLAAFWEIGNWNVILQFLYRVPYGANDPVYDKDLGFYLFSLPAYIAMKNWAMFVLFFSTLYSGLLYWLQGDIALQPAGWSISPRAIAHGSALLGLFMAIKAWSYGLDRYLLLYGDNGVLVGAGYTDIHVELPILWLLITLSIVGALTAWANLWARSYRLPLVALLLVFGTAFLLSGVTATLFQRLYVKPNELELERPYIERSITATREAYKLDRITAKPFPAEQNLTFQTLEANRATIENIRLWDWQPLSDTYAQLQEIRTYYGVRDLDVDRYWLRGTYQSVMISARELKSQLLPSNAQTWVNLHILFTHGNGAVMSPVTQKSVEGLPLLYLRDIPPVADGGPEIREPRIYYGQEKSNYVIVRASTPEFNYPKGNENVYARYDGSGGVSLSGMIRKIIFAHHFNDMNLLLSSYITDDSRIMIRRNVQERTRTIAPFLTLDRDPYLVISEGRLFWIQDAYTTSEYFPSAHPAPGLHLNYIRNSVKAVVDAYNGTVDFYLMDSADPIAATYQRIFPDLFKPFAVMPPDLQKHIRYPEDIFLIQAQLYQTYHMQAADVFYNREDLWQFPRQPAHDGGIIPMAPYYIVMRLPGETQAEFFIMIPMVPSRRDNMIAWLAARCDAPDYGNLIVYEFPKEKLVYGPFQIEARIHQNTEISQQISLWNQMGSRVIRGNLLVVPIENSILYISPLYLRAEQGHLPELKRVIAAYGEHVVMKETLGEALAALFVETGAASAAEGTAAEDSSAGSAARRAQEALERYNRAMEQLRSGDWAGFGREIDAMRGVLEEMSRQSGGR
jgi:uncharacterized membrane protein (UPF0182 family)